LVVTLNQPLLKWEEFKEMTQAYQLSKQRVWEAFKLVKANKGTGGVDDVSMSDFEADLSNNLYKIWNRLRSGSYFPPAVKAVEIAKKSGGIRRLGIPTIGDRVAQMTIKLSFEPKVEPIFHKDSYGYRLGRSAHDAIKVTRTRCWKSNFVLEFDIKGLFDNIDHDLLVKAVKKHTNDKMEILYIERWLKAPILTKDGVLERREKGTPQGGVISPILANLFMHYAMDKWLERTFPHNEFCRYADDGLVHCKSEKQAETIYEALKARFKECGLEMHPDKTKIIYCSSKGKENKSFKNRSFDFLGFTFRRRTAVDPKGEFFCSFLPGISSSSRSAITKKFRALNILSFTHVSLKELAEFINPSIRGWFNYYGKFTKSAMSGIEFYIDSRIAKWLQKKFKKLKQYPGKARSLLNRLRKDCPKMFAHWNWSA
jgi:RNA-directed DNA polymerase